MIIAIIIAFIFWFIYEFARMVGKAQSGDINWEDYEPK